MNLDYFRMHIKQIIKSKKMTLSHLAKLSDLSEDTLRSLIYGKTQDVRLSTIVRIADVLDYSLDSLIGREYVVNNHEIIDSLSRLSERSIRAIQTLTKMELLSTQQAASSNITTIPVFIHTSCFEDGRYFDSNTIIQHDISDYPAHLKEITDCGIMLSSDYYEPTYHANDILLLTTSQKPSEQDIVFYLDDEGRSYIRRVTRTGLEPIGNFGKKISRRDEYLYNPIGIVTKAIKEFDIEQYR